MCFFGPFLPLLARTDRKQGESEGNDIGQTTGLMSIWHALHRPAPEVPPKMGFVCLMQNKNSSSCVYCPHSKNKAVSFGYLLDFCFTMSSNKLLSLEVLKKKKASKEHDLQKKPKYSALHRH